MNVKPALNKLNIQTDDKGFYEGFSKFVTVGSKLAIGTLILLGNHISKKCRKYFKGYSRRH